MSDPDEGELALPEAYDEAVTGTGRIRPAWQTLIGRLGPGGPAHFGELRDEALRLLRQNGVTYTIYGDPQGADRLWPLDIVPLLITSEEWQELESAVRQRAHLLNAVLADIYGPQQMVAEGYIPAALVDANPGFIRPAYGLKPPGGIYLHLYAVDLVRGAEGKWRVLEDRTEAPSGAGYALENRSVIGRVLADCLAECQAVPLAPFFAQLREGLLRLAPTRPGREPRLALLTPGPYNETYFEHVYLARHLGISLVEGADLTVRDRRVFLKTVTALEPIDVILRRTDDEWLDPLALRPDSALGVAGLLEAVRAGNVTIANAVGSGAVQAMAFKPFLPGLCHRLLGEELRLPDVATWWCGGEEEREHVLDTLDHRVIKPAFAAGSGNEAIFVEAMDAERRAALAERIEGAPLEFVGQERVRLAQTPLWDGRSLQPRPYVLRVYVAASPNGFVVMPGGLTRVAATAGGTVVSLQRGGGSKDCWVLGSRIAGARPSPAEERGAPISEAVFHRLAPAELPSRAADGLFWLGRYAERTDGIVRLLRTVIGGLSDATLPWTALDARPALDLLVSLRLADELPWTWNSPADLIAGLVPALADPTHPTGLARNLRSLQRVVAGLRDHLPPDCWNAAMDYARLAQADDADAPNPVQMLLLLDDLVRLGAVLWGTIEETMPRGTGWSFLEIGKRLERALHLLAVLRGVADGANEESRDREHRILATILAITGARPAAHLGRDLDRQAVLGSVLASLNSPRGLAFQLGELVTHLTALPQPNPGALADPGLLLRARQAAEMGIGMMHEAIEAACLPRRRVGNQLSPDPMVEAFAGLVGQLSDISSILTQLYFTHALVRPA